MEKSNAKKSVEDAIKAGEFIAIDPFLTRKAGLLSQVALPAAEYKALGISALVVEKRSKKLKSLLNAIAWTIFKCQRTGVKANVIVQVDAAGFPPLAMGVSPFSEKDPTPVVIIERKKEDKKP